MARTPTEASKKTESMIVYNDTVFRTSKRKIFATLLITCILIFTLVGTLYAFRDHILDFANEKLGTNIALPEVDAKNQKKNPNESGKYKDDLNGGDSDNPLNFLGITIPEEQSATRYGKTVFYPRYFLPDFGRNYPEDTVLTFYIDYNEDGNLTDDEVVESFKKVGTYKVIALFRHDGYADLQIPFTFKVKFNYWAIIFGAAVGLALGFVLFLLAAAGKVRKDRRSRQHFIYVRTRLEAERGGIVCESMAKTKYRGTRKNGRLYLTGKALEFHDKKYHKNYRSFALSVKDIKKIKCSGILGRKLTIRFNDDTRKVKFKLPVGTAKLWKKELMHFRRI